jgi:hypothetical protein
LGADSLTSHRLGRDPQTARALLNLLYLHILQVGWQKKTAGFRACPGMQHN